MKELVILLFVITGIIADATTVTSIFFRIKLGSSVIKILKIISGIYAYTMIASLYYAEGMLFLYVLIIVFQNFLRNIVENIPFKDKTNYMMLDSLVSLIILFKII